jgi:hypothetical protein
MAKVGSTVFCAREGDDYGGSLVGLAMVSRSPAEVTGPLSVPSMMVHSPKLAAALWMLGLMG